jgi:hypothetical protein
MATQADVRRIALSLPDTEEHDVRFAFSVLVKGQTKGFVWAWNERVDPKKPRVPNPTVIALRVASLGEKDLMISADPEKFFTEPHYNGYAAVLVRLKKTKVSELRALLAEAHRCTANAPKRKRK